MSNLGDPSEQDSGSVMMTKIAGAVADEALGKLAADLYKKFLSRPPSSAAQ
jgi:hypothetical protein